MLFNLFDQFLQSTPRNAPFYSEGTVTTPVAEKPQLAGAAAAGLSMKRIKSRKLQPEFPVAAKSSESAVTNCFDPDASTLRVEQEQSLTAVDVSRKYTRCGHIRHYNIIIKC
jgi:hypothetical protein